MTTATATTDGPAAHGGLRGRLAAAGVDRAVWLVAPAALIVGALFIYPFIDGLGLSVQPAEGGVLANYVTFFSNAYERGTIGKTLRLALPATLLNVALSVPVAHALRQPVRGRRLLIGLLVVPVTLGTVLVAQGMIRYFGPVGWFNQALQALGLVDGPVALTNNFWGTFISLVITGFPLSLLLILGHASGIDPDLERAGATLGAGPVRRFWRVSFPLMLPGISMAFVLGFVAAFAVFPSAVMVGNPAGSTRVISIAAYQAAYERFDYPMASTIATIMAAVELAVVGVVLGLRSRLYRGASGGKG